MSWKFPERSRVDWCLPVYDAAFHDKDHTHERVGIGARIAVKGHEVGLIPSCNPANFFAEFKGFGVASMTYNMPWVETQVSAPEDWDLPADGDIDLSTGARRARASRSSVTPTR